MANLWLVVFTCIFVACAVVVNCDVSSSYNAPSLAPALDCSNIIYNMADCITFLSNGSKETKPDGSCCSGFKSVLKTDQSCICEALQNSAQLGIELNMTKAITLPSACGVSAPLSHCALNPPESTPKSAPMPPMAESPAPEPPTIEPPTVEPKTPTVSPSTGGGSAPQVPAPSPSASGAYSTCASFAASVVVMLVASFLA